MKIPFSPPDITEAFKQLGQKLMNGEITPEEHVKEYNRLLKEMSEKYDSQWRPHEHI